MTTAGRFFLGHEAQVDHVLVSGMPFLKKWSQNEPFRRPRYYLDSPSRVCLARDTDIAIASAIIDYRSRRCRFDSCRVHQPSLGSAQATRAKAGAAP